MMKSVNRVHACPKQSRNSLWYLPRGFAAIAVKEQAQQLLQSNAALVTQIRGILAGTAMAGKEAQVMAAANMLRREPLVVANALAGTTPASSEQPKDSPVNPPVVRSLILTAEGNWAKVTAVTGPDGAPAGSLILPRSPTWRPSYSGPINQPLPETIYLYPGDVHIHHGGSNAGSYNQYFRGGALTDLLDFTRDPLNPEHGYAMVIQRVPQSTPGGARYYLASTRKGEVIEVAITQFRSKQSGQLMLRIPKIADGSATVLYKGGDFPRQKAVDESGFHKSSSGVYLPSFNVPETLKEVTAGFVPDLEWSYAGLGRDEGLIRQYLEDIVPHSQSDAKRVWIGLTAGDPADPNNLKQIYAILRYANEKDPDGSRLRFVLGETTLAKEGVTSNLRKKPDLDNPKAINQLLGFTDQFKGLIVCHVDSGTPSTLSTGIGGQVGTVLLAAPSNYANVDATLNIFAQHPDTTIIWAHGGGVGRFIQPAPDHLLKTMQRVLDDQKLNHVHFDLSWDVVIKNFVKAGLIQQLARLVNAHPDRFLYGSDSVGASTAKDGRPEYGKFSATMQQLLDSKFLDMLVEPHQFLRGNFDRLVIPAADRLNDFRVKNRDFIHNYPPPPVD